MAHKSTRHIIHEIYSDVMFELAQEAALLNIVMDDLDAVVSVLEDESEFLSLLTLAHLKETEKTAMIRRVFKGQINDLTLDFLCVLAKRNRMGFLHGISESYQNLLDEHKNRHRIEVTLAKEPTDEQIVKLKQDLADAINAEVKMSVAVDPSILGGIIIRKGDLMIDNSARSILDRTVNAIMKKSKNKIESE